MRQHYPVQPTDALRMHMWMMPQRNWRKVGSERDSDELLEVANHSLNTHAEEVVYVCARWIEVY
jgi:hypothetical protein